MSDMQDTPCHMCSGIHHVIHCKESCRRSMSHVAHAAYTMSYTLLLHLYLETSGDSVSAHHFVSNHLTFVICLPLRGVWRKMCTHMQIDTVVEHTYVQIDTHMQRDAHTWANRHTHVEIRTERERMYVYEYVCVCVCVCTYS